MEPKSEVIEQIEPVEATELDVEPTITETATWTLAGAVMVARYTRPGHPDRYKVNGKDSDKDGAMVAVGGVMGKRVTFGKDRKPKK